MYKYEMIAEEIQKKIKDGTYPPDTRLPQEMEMCKIYDASRITIREAMELLVAKGLITKRRGAGTFVKAVAPGMTDQVGFSKSGKKKKKWFWGNAAYPYELKQAGRYEFGLKKASKEVAEKLQVAENAFVCYICRTRLVDGKPYVVEYTYMPTDFITGITEDVVKSSIYSYLENDLGLKIQSAHRIARADMPTEQEKKWLDIGDQVLPVLEVEQVAYLDDGRIFEYSISRHRADRFELKSVSIH